MKLLPFTVNFGYLHCFNLNSPVRLSIVLIFATCLGFMPINF